MSGSKALSHDIGAFVNVQANPVPTGAAGTVNGAAVDRQDYLSCVLLLTAGSATGTPSTQTANAKIQDSADGSTGWADLTGAAVTELDTDDTESYVDVDLHAAKRYIRVVQVLALSGGSSPTWPIASVLVLGGDRVLPVA